LCTNLTYPDET